MFETVLHRYSIFIIQWVYIFVGLLLISVILISVIFLIPLKAPGMLDVECLGVENNTIYLRAEELGSMGEYVGYRSIYSNGKIIIIPYGRLWTTKALRQSFKISYNNKDINEIYILQPDKEVKLVWTAEQGVIK